MISKSEIRDRLADVAAGKLPLWDFHRWIESASYNMHQDSGADAIELVGSIELIFAEYDLGVFAQNELSRNLAALIGPVPAAMRISVSNNFRLLALPAFSLFSQARIAV